MYSRVLGASAKKFHHQNLIRENILIIAARIIVLACILYLFRLKFVENSSAHSGKIPRAELALSLLADLERRIEKVTIITKKILIGGERIRIAANIRNIMKQARSYA